jgi:phosphopantothenate-cysteine ligase
MKILITAGGTTEKIDEVRRIANNSTGSLGVKIAEAFLALGDRVEKIVYVCGSNALPPPESDKIEILRIGSVADLKHTLQQVFSRCEMDAVIHCMAVSDYTVRNVTTAEAAANAFVEALGNPDLSAPYSKEQLKGLLKECLYRDANIARGGKISSETEDLMILLEKTPKIISFIREMQPHTVLVGFKLLSRVERSVLIDTAYALLKKNHCDFVFANDGKDITPQNHLGYLVSPDGSYEEVSGREQIADKIASAVAGKAAEKGR